MTGIPHQAIDLAAGERPRTPWIAVAGAKGGVGKTLIATNLALLLDRAGYRTLLVDFDPGCGNVGVHLRLTAERDLEHVAAGECSAGTAIVSGPGRTGVLLGRSGSTMLASATEERVRATLAAIAHAAADFDAVIVDTGAGLGAPMLAAAERADLTLAVTTPDVSALTDTYALCKVLHQRGRPLPALVVNRVRNRDEAMRTAARLDGVTQRFLGHKGRLSGWVCDDPLVELSIRDQRPLALFGQGPGLEDLRSVCAAALAALPPLRRRRPSPTPRVVRLRPAMPTPST